MYRELVRSAYTCAARFRALMNMSYDDMLDGDVELLSRLHRMPLGRWLMVRFFFARSRHRRLFSPLLPPRLPLRGVDDCLMIRLALFDNEGEAIFSISIATMISCGTGQQHWEYLVLAYFT